MSDPQPVGGWICSTECTFWRKDVARCDHTHSEWQDPCFPAIRALLARVAELEEKIASEYSDHGLLEQLKETRHVNLSLRNELSRAVGMDRYLEISAAIDAAMGERGRMDCVEVSDD
jgi:hypothetical protein